MKLIVLSPSDLKETELPTLLYMFENGLRTYHVRKTHYSTRELKKYIEEIPEKYHPRLVIHTHHDLAGQFNLKGVYISRSHKKRRFKTAWRLFWLRLRGKHLKRSATIRSIESLLDPQGRFDYVMLSPVFDGISEKFQAGFTDTEIRNGIKNSPCEVYARGGITVDTIAKAHSLGFAGIVFYSGLWKTPQPIETFKKIKDEFQDLGIPME